MKKQEAAPEAAPETKKKAATKLVAKKNFEIFQNEYHRVIKVGDDLSDVPERFHENLKTEGVL